MLPASFFLILSRISDFDLLVSLSSAFSSNPRLTFTTLWRLLIVFACAQTGLFKPLLLLPIAARVLGLERLRIVIRARSVDFSKSALANSRLRMAPLLPILAAVGLRYITALDIVNNIVLYTITCRHDIMSRRGRIQVDVLPCPVDATLGQEMGHAFAIALTVFKCITLLMVHGYAHMLQSLLQAQLTAAYARCRILLIEVRCDPLVPFLDHRSIVESNSFPLCSNFVKTVISVLENLLSVRWERHKRFLFVRRCRWRGNYVLNMHVYLVIIRLYCKRLMLMLVIACGEGLIPTLISSWRIEHELTLLLLRILDWGRAANPCRFRWYVIDATWLLNVQSELTRIR